MAFQRLKFISTDFINQMFGPLYILSATTVLESVYHFFKFQQFHRTSYKLDTPYKVSLEED